MPITTKPIEALTPSDFIEEWGDYNIGDGVPSPDKLTEVERALHAIEEFLVEPIEKALKGLVEATAVGEGLLPEDERPVDYADVGLLITWADKLRLNCRYLLQDVADITVLAHEDLDSIAQGYRVFDGGVLADAKSNGRLRRFYGLDRELV